MKIIIGLGNPGTEYLNTRHNAGIFLVDQLASLPVYQSEYGWRKNFGALVYKSSELVLVKTKDVFMNESGRLVRIPIDNGQWTMDNLKNLYVAHDDLDIKLGEYKIQFGKGPKEHGGVNSIEQALGTKDFWRIRIGVDNRGQGLGNRETGEEYVLKSFSLEERKVLEGVLDEIIKTIN